MRDEVAPGVRAGMRAAIPIAIGYLGIGFAAGIVGANAGLSPVEITLLSLLLFAGSAQFVFAELYVGSAITLLVTIFLVNLRHLLYSTAMAPRAQHLGPGARSVIGAQLTDETFSLATSLHRGRLPSAAWMIALNMTAYFAWASGNLTGAVIGGAVAGVEALGLDFALAAMFAALLMLQVTGATNRVSVSIVATVSAIVMIVLELAHPHPLNLLVATVVAATLGVVAFSGPNRGAPENTGGMP